jgi:hypothetical protein
VVSEPLGTDGVVYEFGIVRDTVTSKDIEGADQEEKGEDVPGKTMRMTKLQTQAMAPAMRYMYFHVELPNFPLLM